MFKKPEKLSQTFRHERHSRKYLCDEEPPKMCQAKTTQFKRFQEIKTLFVKQIPVRACPWVFWASLLRLQQGMKPALPGAPILDDSHAFAQHRAQSLVSRRCPWSLIFQKTFLTCECLQYETYTCDDFQIAPIFTIVIISLIRFGLFSSFFVFVLAGSSSFWFFACFLPPLSWFFHLFQYFFLVNHFFGNGSKKEVSVGTRPTNTHGVCRLCAGRARHTEASGQGHFECFYGSDGPGMECPRGTRHPVTSTVLHWW